jgi:membrane protein implicated in regulation of membrane protease activity
MLGLRQPGHSRIIASVLIAATAVGAVLAGLSFIESGWYLIAAVTLLLLFGDELLALLILQSRTKGAPLVGKEAMIGQIATVADTFEPAIRSRIMRGKVRLNGEVWSAEAEKPAHEQLVAGKAVRIRSISGLTVLVEPVPHEK